MHLARSHTPVREHILGRRKRTNSRQTTFRNATSTRAWRERRSILITSEWLLMLPHTRSLHACIQRSKVSEHSNRVKSRAHKMPPRGKHMPGSTYASFASAVPAPCAPCLAFARGALFGGARLGQRGGGKSEHGVRSLAPLDAFAAVFPCHPVPRERALDAHQAHQTASSRASQRGGRGVFQQT